MGCDLITYMVVGKPKIKKTKAQVAAYWKKHQEFLKLDESTEEIAVPNEYKEGFESSAEFAEFVKEFVKFWNFPGARDTNARTFGKGKSKRQIVVSGDMSWGDEPDGYGYQLFRRVFDNELGDFFDLI